MPVVDCQPPNPVLTPNACDVIKTKVNGSVVDDAMLRRIFLLQRHPTTVLECAFVHVVLLAYLISAVTVAVTSRHVVSRRSSPEVVVRKSVAAVVGSSRLLECDVRSPTTSKVYVEQIITWRKQGTEVGNPSYHVTHRDNSTRYHIMAYHVTLYSAILSRHDATMFVDNLQPSRAYW